MKNKCLILNHNVVNQNLYASILAHSLEISYLLTIKMKLKNAENYNNGKNCTEFCVNEVSPPREYFTITD